MNRTTRDFPEPRAHSKVPCQRQAVARRPSASTRLNNLADARPDSGAPLHRHSQLAGR